MLINATYDDTNAIITTFFPPGTTLYDIYMRHAEAVTVKALAVAARVDHLDPDTELIEQAAMLHDIGIWLTHSKAIGCTGPYPYICHGYLGRSLLEKFGLPRHGLVCERHVGVGISEADIRSQRLPLPLRDMCPVSLAEEIICYADLFFSKKKGRRIKSVNEIIRKLSSYGQDKVRRFESWQERFE